MEHQLRRAGVITRWQYVAFGALFGIAVVVGAYLPPGGTGGAFALIAIVLSTVTFVTRHEVGREVVYERSAGRILYEIVASIVVVASLGIATFVVRGSEFIWLCWVLGALSFVLLASVGWMKKPVLRRPLHTAAAQTAS